MLWKYIEIMELIALSAEIRTKFAPRWEFIDDKRSFDNLKIEFEV